jgi:predicted outer membrane repeat protein
MKRIILAGAVLLLISKAFGAELLVPSQFPTIQSAINAAGNGDTVVVAPGLYEGPNNINLDLQGKPITVRSVDPNNHWVVSSTIIDCDGSGIGFYFQSGENANSSVEGLTITDGSASNGGAISVLSACSPVIRNCAIINNSSTAYGGGIYSAGSPTIIGCTISGNHAAYGGGIYCSGSTSTATIIDCTISSNTAVNYGGGIYAMGTFIVDNCRIVKNQAVAGGGIYVTLPSSTKIMKVSRTLIAGNIASTAGGIYTYRGTLDIDNSMVGGNFSQTNGGGMYISSQASVNAKGCTFAGNEAIGSGGGIFTSGKLSANNSIFWGNSDNSGIGLTAQINPFYANYPILFSCIQDDDPNDASIPFGGEENGNIDDNPMFVREPNDGGDGWGVGDNDDYGDLHLRPDSPCINAGSPLYKGLGATDIDGQPRVIGSAVDMGADEYGKVIVVTRPVEGEVWATGSKRKIEWTQYGVGSVDVLLSTDAGENWETIAEGITDANTYLWEIPDDIESNQCMIFVVPSDEDPNVVCRESGLFTVSWYPVQPAVPPEWLRRGLLPGPDLSENKGPQLGCVKWVFDTNGPVSSQVAVTRPYWNSYGVYIGCEDGLIYALDDLGEFIWSCDINTPIVGSPAVGYYWMVYVAGQDGRLYAIDDFGDVRWTQTTDAPIYSTPVVGYSGKIYVGSEDGLIYAFDADGSELWTFETKGPGSVNGAILATPGVDKNGTVYIAGFYDPNLYALDSNTGSVKWACRFPSASDPNNTKCSQLLTSPVTGPDGTIYQTLINDPNLYAIDPCTGNIIWTTSLRLSPDTNSSGWSSPAVGPDGTIYVSFDDPYLRAVNPDGTIKWITRLGMVGGFTLSIDRDGFIYAASDDGYVCVVDSNGVELSRFKGDDWVSFPAIAEDGTLIVSDSNNRVWAITDTPCESQQPALHWPADIQPSWAVDFMDFALLANNWLDCTDPDNESCGDGIWGYGTYALGDIDRNLYVDFRDFAAMADKWLMGAN